MQDTPSKTSLKVLELQAIGSWGQLTEHIAWASFFFGTLIFQIFASDHFLDTRH